MEEMAENVEAKEESFSFEKETYQFFKKLGLDKEPVLHLVIRNVQNEIKKKAGNVADINHKKKRGRSTETISTRCHFSRSLVKLQRLIKKRHYKALGETPFSLLFHSLWGGNFCSTFCLNSTDVLDFIISNYNRSDETFTINKHTFGMDVEDVSKILGITDGNEKFDFAKSKGHEEARWYKQKGLDLYKKANELRGKKANDQGTKKEHKKGVLAPEVVLALMKDICEDENRVEDFTRLACLYLLCTCLDPASNGSLVKHLDSVEDLEKMKRIDWSSHILEVLKNELKEGKKKNYNGCTILLPFLVCEKAKVVDPVQTSSESPKYLNWNLSSLNTAIKSLKGVEQPGDQDLDQSLKDDNENPDPLDNENELTDDELQRNATIVDPKENSELNRMERKTAQEGNISLITDQEKRVLRNKKTKKEVNQKKKSQEPVIVPHGRVLRDRKTLKGIKN